MPLFQFNGVSWETPWCKPHLHTLLLVISVEQALLDYLHSHRQPWLKRDIELVLEEPEIAPVWKEAYVGIHVRRGDKLVHEARRHEVEV